MTQDNHHTQQGRQQSPHAEFFKNIFSRPDSSRALLRQYLPEAIGKQLDFSGLRVGKDSFVDDNLKNHFADVVVSIPLLERHDTLHVYCLLEHKSAPDYLVGLQLLRYMALQWQELYKQKLLPENGKLPPIVPLVLYHGPPKWPHSCRFQDVVAQPFAGLKGYIPDFAFDLLDVREMAPAKRQDNLLARY